MSQTVVDRPVAPGSAEEELRDWIRRVLRHLGVTATDLSRQAGVPQTALTRFLNAESHSLQVKTLVKVANVSPIEPPTPILALIDTARLRSKEQEVNATGSNAARDLPVWGVIPVRRTGEFRLNPLPVATYRRPVHLAAGRRIAVFYAPDDSMAPRWDEGEPVVVDLARPATVGGYALIRLTPVDDPDDSETHLFRRYWGRSDGRLKIESLDQVERAPVPLDRVLEVRRVLDWKDMLA